MFAANYLEMISLSLEKPRRKKKIANLKNVNFSGCLDGSVG